MVHPSAARLCGVRWQQVFIVGVPAAPHTDADATREPVRGRSRRTETETEEEEPTAEAQAYADSKRLPRLDGDPALERPEQPLAACRRAAASRCRSPRRAPTRRTSATSPSSRIPATHRQRQHVRPAEPERCVHAGADRLRRGAHDDRLPLARSAPASRSTDDDTSEFTVPFTFSFYGKDQTQAFRQLGRQHHVRARPTPRAPTATSRGC